jgi:SNF2 family DNA or RNA helicase
MKFTPFPYQELGINHLVSHDEAALFAGMGLGKTAMTLAALARLIADGACKGALIIAPLRVSTITWPDEVAQWDEFKWMKIVSLRTEEGIEAWNNKEACIFTVNYEALFHPSYDEEGNMVRDTGILTRLIKGRRTTQLPVDTIIWDELSCAKDPDSKRINAFRKFRHRFKRHWGLTGTPTPNGYLDLFAQIRLLDDGKLFGKFKTHFRRRYFYPTDFMQRKWEVMPGNEELIERELLKIALTLRSEDYLDIPPTQTIDVPVKLPARAMDIYKKLEKLLIVRLADSKVLAVNQAVLVGKLQQILGGSVFAESVNDLYRILDEPEDTRVVTNIHNAKINALKTLWKQEGHAPMMVAVKYTHERDRILEAIPEAVAFSSKRVPEWNAGKIGLLITHPASMKYGLNMQKGGCRTCWFTPTYSYDEYSQYNARVARTGQTEESKFFRLLVPGTIDEAVVATLERKGNIQASLLRNLVNLQEAEASDMEKLKTMDNLLSLRAS